MWLTRRAAQLDTAFHFPKELYMDRYLYSARRDCLPRRAAARQINADKAPAPPPRGAPHPQSGGLAADW